MEKSYYESGYDKREALGQERELLRYPDLQGVRRRRDDGGGLSRGLNI